MTEVTRRDGISGSNIAAICGLNPYRTPTDAWLSIMGLKDELEDNEAKRWGKALEPVLAQRYHEDTGAILFPSIKTGFDYQRPLFHPDVPWWLGTPDRLVVDDPVMQTENLDEAHEMVKHPDFWKHVLGLWEGKTGGARQKFFWGNDYDEVVTIPEMYLCQVAWYFPIARVQWCDVSVLLDTNKYQCPRIIREEPLINALYQVGARFWQDHILTNQPPPVEASPAWKQYLKKRFPAEQGPEFLTANEEMQAVAFALDEARRNTKKWEEYKELQENKLKALIGSFAGVRGEGWSPPSEESPETFPWEITWKANKASKVTDWEKAFRTLSEGIDPAQVQFILEQHTTEEPGARVLRCSFPKKPPKKKGGKK